MEDWQDLGVHLNNVGEMASVFAKDFGAENTARILGEIHDIGKLSNEFQQYLAETRDSEEEEDNSYNGSKSKRGPDHSTAGAKWLEERLKLGRLFAYVTAGHHTGLPDGISTHLSSLENRLKKSIPCFPLSEKRIKLELEEGLVCQEAKPFLKDGGFTFSLYLRMLFSCLVDADYLDTENFIDGIQSKTRKSKEKLKTAELLERLEAYYTLLDDKIRKAGRQEDCVVKARNKVLLDCIEASEKAQGIFTLQVPTGGGKTLSSMMFALRHAVNHKLNRVIFVIPFTSIIEQNAQIFRDIFGDENVLELHHNIDPDKITARNKLLSENWDAPIIITTNVQFFESLMNHRTSKCRKLHNIAKSVVVIDEAQAIPIGVLNPCLQCLKSLTKFNTSIVLCTATLPVFFDKSLFGHNVLEGAIDIIKDKNLLYKNLDRVKTEVLPGNTNDKEVIDRLKKENVALVVVNTRKHAKDLYVLAKSAFGNSKHIFHLSAQMCGAHRLCVIKEVKKLLKEKTPCILISTQLIEAGVDIDFPCVYRELAGVDSMSQAAGRCNREGLEGKGRVFLFKNNEYRPPMSLTSQIQEGTLVVTSGENVSDPIGLKSVRLYFERLFSSIKRGNTTAMDIYEILTCLPLNMPRDKEGFLSFQFKTAGEKFKLISDDCLNVIVPYDSISRKLYEELRSEMSPRRQRDIARRLQRYSVSLYETAQTREVVESVHDTYLFLKSPERYYSQEVGIVLNSNNNAI